MICYAHIKRHIIVKGRVSMHGKKFYGYLLISLFCYGCSSFVCIWMTLLLGKILDYAN